MRLQAIAAGAVLAALMALPSVADAATWGRTTGNVNMRTCASTSCPKILVVPYGASVRVTGSQNGWYYLSYSNVSGYVSGNYVAVGNAPYVQPMRPPPPPYGYYQKPRWDDHYGAWYDGRRWWYNGRWYNQPSGFFFGIRIGG